MLGALRRAGFGADEAVAGYHALIGLTLGAAAIDAPVAQLAPAERERLYERWRADYRGLDPARFGDVAAVADRLYRGSAEGRFAFALDLMLDGRGPRYVTGASSAASRPAATTTRPSSAIVWPSSGRSKCPAVNRPACSFAPVE